MEHIEFNFIGKFGDKIKFICELESSFGRITRVSRYNVHMFINNCFKKTYDNVYSYSYTDLNKQINILFNNF